MNQVPTGQDMPGLIGIPIFDFALAGELLRIYPGWRPGDFNQFTDMMVQHGCGNAETPEHSADYWRKNIATDASPFWLTFKQAQGGRPSPHHSWLPVKRPSWVSEMTAQNR